jgi:hypothetical protein
MAGDEIHDPPRTRFFRRVAYAETGCWLWIGHASGGYGRIRIEGIRVQAHRFSYELFVGRIPDGLQLDHLCRNRLCVNPDHLEPVTPRENYLRGESPMARQARQSHCHLGHPLAGPNLRVRKNGKRECRECALCAQRAHREVNRDAINERKRQLYAARGG